MKEKSITAEEFDKKFDNGEDMLEYLDLSSIKRPRLVEKRVSIDMPVWMIQELDKEAKRLGVTRKSVIRGLISEKLKEK